jgi:hypothetical protein
VDIGKATGARRRQSATIIANNEELAAKYTRTEKDLKKVQHFCKIIAHGEWLETTRL